MFMARWKKDLAKADCTICFYSINASLLFVYLNLVFIIFENQKQVILLEW